MNPTHKKITQKTYSVEKFDKELNRKVICVYRIEETKDKFREYYFGELGWRDKEMIKSILEKQKRNEEYQRQREARYNKYILKGRNSSVV